MEGEKLKITDWAIEDRPREKLLLKGRNALSDAELLAILLGSGTVSMTAVELGKLILSGANNDLHQLAKMSIKELQKFKGVGEAKAITIVAALELGRRRKETEATKIPTIKTSEEAYNAIKPYLLDLPHEEFWAIFLNRANRIIKIQRISQGGVSTTVVDPKILFREAIENGAVNIIVFHNHPSENTKPSEADISITKKLVEAGKVLEINVLDHIIFTNQAYYSFADNDFM
jgi:DNA repair protein RadC